MIKFKSIALILIVLFLIVPVVTAAPLSDSEEIEAEGYVDDLGDGSITVDGTTFIVNSNTIITTAIMADLPVLSQMLSRLFESSQ